MMRVGRRAFLGGSFGLAACARVSNETVLVAMAGAMNANLNGVWVWMSAFADVLRDAGIEVEIHANGALGGEADRTELAALGLLHANDAGASELEVFSQAYVGLSLPFMFETTEHFEAVIDAPGFRSWVDEDLDGAGLVFADAALLGGMSGLFTTGAPIETADDLAGVRLRAMGGRDLELIRALGGSGVQVAWAEVPQALETGIAQGYLNPPIAAVLFGHGSQLDFFTDARINPAHRPIVLSRIWLSTLPARQRRVVDEAIAAGRAANRRWAQEASTRDLAALTDIGVETIALSGAQRRTFVERAVRAYPRMCGEDAIRRIRVLVEAARP